MFVSTTQFSLKHILLYPEFFLDTYRAMKQIRQSEGVIKVRINPITLRTISAWKTKEEMMNFRNSGAHRNAMKKTSKFGSIKSVVWETDTIPSWKEAISMLETATV